MPLPPPHQLLIQIIHLLTEIFLDHPILKHVTLPSANIPYPPPMFYFFPQNVSCLTINIFYLFILSLFSTPLYYEIA